jgi:hypothetical protein
VNTVTEKMEREKSAFEAARKAGLPITPLDVAMGDKPDLRVLTSQGLIGIELSEVLPLPQNPTFNSSVAEAANHEGSVLLAERTYYNNKGAVQVKVTTYPWNVVRTRNTKREMGHELASFVRSHCHEATPTKSFTRLHGIPDGFGVVSIHAGSGSWHAGQSVDVTFDGIYDQLADRIANKDALLSAYRSNLPNAPIWLLLYSCWEISRSLPMPSRILEWRYPFGFDRVFFHAASSECVEEIHRWR